MNFTCNECNDTGSRDKLGTYLDCNECGTSATRRDLNDFVKSLGPTHPEDVALAIHQRALAMAPKQEELDAMREALRNANHKFFAANEKLQALAAPAAANGALTDEQIMRIACDMKQRNANVWPGDVAYARAILAAAGPDAALIEDAKRYRYLRDTASEDMPTWPVNGSCWVVQYHHPKGTIPELKSAGFASELDRAIDAALSGAKGN